MPFRTDDGQTAQFADTLAQLDIGTTAGHVGCDRHRPLLACLFDDLRFACMVLRV